jgi:hypothetical protein
MITHCLPLFRVAEAFALRSAALSEAIHVLVDCEG